MKSVLINLLNFRVIENTFRNNNYNNILKELKILKKKKKKFKDIDYWSINNKFQNLICKFGYISKKGKKDKEGKRKGWSELLWALHI